MHNTHGVTSVEISAGGVVAAGSEKERRYKNRYDPERGSEKRGSRGGLSKKAESAGAEDRERQKDGRGGGRQ